MLSRSPPAPLTGAWLSASITSKRGARSHGGCLLVHWGDRGFALATDEVELAPNAGG